MSSRNKDRVKKPVADVPQNIDEAAICLGHIGDIQRQIDAEQNRFEDAVSVLEKDLSKHIKNLQNVRDRYRDNLFAFAQANRDQLTNNGKRKTIKVRTGEFGWRLPPESVTITDQETAISFIKAMDWAEKLLKVTEAIPKKHCQEHRELAEQVPGISFRQDEEVFAKPLELEVEDTTQKDKEKRTA